MFIKQTTKRVKGKTYVNHLLVESIATARGPRHRTICSLGSLPPAPREEWLALAHQVQDALAGQAELFPHPKMGEVVTKAKQETQTKPSRTNTDLVAVHTDRVEVIDAREAGPVHVGHQMCLRLGLDSILAEAGLSQRARQLTEAMVLNRLVKPLSEHAMPDWIRRVAMSDILGVDFERLNHHALYRNLDRLHPQRILIEQRLSEAERTLFNLDESFFLYDLTSTYFEGQCPRNPQAKRGYSRDKRPDCKQVVVGLVLDRDGFPKAHEVFEGNRVDRTTVDEMLDALEQRSGKSEGTTVVVDRGMAYDDNLKQIKDRGYHYLVACRQGERDQYLDEFEDDSGWEEILRKPSPRNPKQKKARVWIKCCGGEGEVKILCRSDGRKKKDRAIREKHEQRLLKDLKKLAERIRKGGLVNSDKIHQSIGRLKERYPRVARYYKISYDAKVRTLTWHEDGEKKRKAQWLDGGYLLKSSRSNLTHEEIWRTYVLLTRVESAFRSMKSPLMERPIFHHLEHRVQTHIFLCVLAYHLLVSVEKHFLDQGIHTSWDTLRQELSTHQVVTILLPADNGECLKIRKGTTPEPLHREIYRTLGIPAQVMKPQKTWVADSH